MDQNLNPHEALTQIETIIGSSASTIISAPEFNMPKLRDLLTCLNKISLGPFHAKEQRKTIVALHRLIAVTATKIFEDIIPNYRIKQGEESEEHVRKDVAKLRQYERTFSSIYKNQYLDYLKRMLDCTKKNPPSNFYTDLIRTDQDDRLKLAETAVECFGQILAAHPHFNFRDQLITYLVESNAQSKFERCAEIACKYLCMTLDNDQLGDVSLEISSKICEIAKKRKLSISPMLFQTLLHLRLIDVKLADADERAKKRAEQDKLAAMKKQQSRKERKKMKKMKKLKNELLEAEAHTTSDQKLKFHRVILKKVFVTYFRLLRYHEDLMGEQKETEKFVNLLPPVLEGVAKFAHLIDVTICTDMFPMINRLLNNRAVSTNCKLLCIHTVFVMYKSLESELGQVDPESFYKHFYVILTNIDPSRLTEQEFTSLSACVHLMLIKRAKYVNNQRYCAFVRRLSVLALNVSPVMANQVLDLVKTLLIQRPSAAGLMDSSNCSNFGSGQIDMEIDDPDFSHADSSVAWEMHMLRRHAANTVRESVQTCMCP